MPNPLEDEVGPGPNTGRQAGERIGGFTLLEPLGQGGMGEVWVAEQESLGRRVALKLLRPGWLQDADVERFVREARAGGGLAHRGLVTVLDHGEDAGRPWIAMDLVPGGRSLTDEIARWRGAEVPAADHAARVAALVGDVADALHVVHEAGILHRDLKPSNILVDPDGVPRVADFGLAKVQGETSLTETGMTSGTVAFMSPEQVQGLELTAASDIFSLGAVLYEALTLRRAFEGDTARQVQLKVLLEDPTPPSKVASRVPRELELICFKALEKAPGRRYASMAALRDDLRRFLASEPIEARAPSLPRRALLWSKRHPGRSAALIIGSLSLVAIAGLALNLLRLNRDLRSETELASAGLDKSLEAVDEMLLQVGGEEFADVPQLTSVRESLLDRAEELYVEILELERASRGASDRGSDQQRSVSRALAQVARLRGDHGDARDRWLALAAEARERRAAAPADAEAVRELAEVLIEIARNEASLGEYERARDRTWECIELLDPSTETLTSSAGVPLLAYALHQAAQLEFQLGSLERAAEFEERALTEARAALGSTDTAAGAKEVLALALSHRGSILLEQRDLEGARPYFLEARDLAQERIDAADAGLADRMAWVQVQMSLAQVAYYLEDPASARDNWLAALETQEALVASFPGAPVLVTKAIDILLALAATQEPAEALGFVQRAEELADDLARQHPDEAEHSQIACHVGLQRAALTVKTGRPEDALEIFDRTAACFALAIESSANPGLERARSQAWHGKAFALNRLGRYRESLDAVRNGYIPGKLDWLLLRRFVSPLMVGLELARADADLDAEELAVFEEDLIGLALTLMEQSVEAGYRHAEDYLHGPDLAPLREHERFRALEERVTSAVE